jgi:glycosyltransferase involved in cell wall biosynthesis
MPKKVVHVSSAHSASDIRIFKKQCRSLAKAGYEVVLVIPHSHDEIVEGVQVRAVPMPVSRKERMLKTTKLVWEAAKKESPELYHFHDPELLIGAVKLAKTGAKVIYDVHENTPADLLSPTDKFYIPNWSRKIVSKVFGWYEYRASTRMCALIPVVDAHICRFQPEKCVVLQNYPILADMSQPTTPYEDRPNTAIFTGGFSIDRCSIEIVEALSLVDKKFNAKLCIAGPSDEEELLNRLKSMPGWSQVDFLGRVPQKLVCDRMAESKTGLAMISADKYELDCSTNKVFEYMVAGIPLIVTPVRSWSEIVRKHDCGIVLENGSPESFAKAMTQLFSDQHEANRMGQNGRRAALENYTWESEERKLIDLYERLIGKP